MATAGLNCAGDGTLFIVDDSQLSNDDVLTVSSMQGVTAITCPLIYRIQGSQSTYAAFLAHLTPQYPGMTVNYTYETSVGGLLSLLRSHFRGYVIANLTDGSTSTAFTVAAAVPAVIVTEANVAYAVSAGLSLLDDVRGVSVASALAKYNTSANSFNRRVITLQDPSKYCCLGDYSIFARSINYWDTDMSSPFSQQVLSSTTSPAAMFGWGASEDETVAAGAEYGVFVHGSDWARNLATLSNFDVKEDFKQKRRPAPAALRVAPAVHSVCFVMTDGDNIQWLLNGFTSDPRWWGSPDRGHVSLGWTLSPALRDLASIVMQYLYTTASNGTSGQDEFIAGVSGLGYTFPDQMHSATDLQQFVQLTGEYVAADDLRHVNVLAEQYSTSAAEAYTANPSIDSVIWYDYASYSALNGNITFLNSKPVIGARLQLWTGVFESPATLLAKLLLQAKDPTSPAGYSLVPVHVWSNNVTEVRGVADALAAAGGFQVLTPTQFVDAVLVNLPHQ